MPKRWGSCKTVTDTRSQDRSSRREGQQGALWEVDCEPLLWLGAPVGRQGDGVPVV